MIARFPGDNSEHPASSQWVIETNLECLKDPRVSEVLNWYKSDTPITIVRNECVLNAIDMGVDLLVMIDSDMKPDHQAPKIPSDRKFWKSSFDHWYENYHKGPAIIAAPYVGPAPSEIPYIFQWKTRESGHPNPDWQLEMFSREAAAERSGFEQVPALPTGLIAIDMRVFTGFDYQGQHVKLAPPWFYYEYHDDFQARKASTEDVTFTRDAHILGARVMVNWDAWAIHIKLKECCKPQILPPNMVGDAYKKALGVLPSDESMVILGDSPAPRPKQLVNPKDPAIEQPAEASVAPAPLKVVHGAKRGPKRRKRA